MRDAATMRALIERVEKASGPSFQMEHDIARAIGHEGIPPKPYTASLDAAVSLLPRGCLWTLDCLGHAFVLYADVPRINASAATPALALVAAALRARLAGEVGDG